MIRQSLELAADWRFQPDPYGEGEDLSYFGQEYDTSQWREVTVPCLFDQCGPDLASYEGMGWFRTAVVIPYAWNDRYISLRFEGNAYRSKVWINGRLVGESTAPFLPFEFRIDKLVRFGQESIITVSVDNTRSASSVPGLQRGWRPYGGILRSVSLIATSPHRIMRMRVTAVPGSPSELSLLANVINSSPRDSKGYLAIHLIDTHNRCIAEWNSPHQQIASNDTAVFTADRVAVQDIQPWSPGSPALYQLSITLVVEGCAVDETSCRIGFRRIEVDSNGLLLNGERLYLRGFNRHDDSPKSGMIFDENVMRCDFDHIKRLGSNFVRLAHYPQHPKILDYCDEIGLIVMDEVPLYWWNGYEDGRDCFIRKTEDAKNQIRLLIERDRNHPSVIFWSVSNETEEFRPEVSAGNAALVAWAKELDGSRLAVHVSNRWTTDPHFEADDVVCVNGYPSWDGRCWQKNPKYDVRVSQAWWRDQLAKLRQSYPTKPILVTEFGYPALAGVVDNALSEDMQVSAIELESGGMTAPYICGKTIWCYADHPWPEENFINYLTTAPFGVLTRDRCERKACSAVARIFGKESH